MKAAIKVFILLSMGIVMMDIMLNKYHEYRYGPYKKVTAEVVSFYGACKSSRHTGSRFSNLEVLINGQLKKSTYPFIGLYPWRFCFGHKFYSLYDYQLIESLKQENVKLVLLLDKNENFYVGKTNLIFDYFLLLIQIILFIFFSKKINQ